MSASQGCFWFAWGLIFYAYLIFPILLACCARLFGSARHAEASNRPDADLPPIAIVVAAYNEAHVIAQKLQNTWSLDYPADKIRLYIGSDGSDDGTNAILQACDDVRLKAYCFAARRGKISVLNDLMQHVKEDIVVMSDANTMFAPDAARLLVAHFDDPQVGCVSGELTLEQNGGVSGEGLYWKYEGWIKRSESRLGFLIGCNGGIFALRKELYEPLPTTTLVEDFVLTCRILEKRSQVRFEPKARGVEPAASSAQAEMVRKIRIGAGGFQALGLNRALLHPRYGMISVAFWGHKVLRWFAPHLYLLALAANIALVASPLFQLILLAQVLGLGVAFWGYLGRGLPRLLRPISYFYLMNYALWRGFLRFLFKRQHVTWERSAPLPSSSLTSLETEAP